MKVTFLAPHIRIAGGVRAILTHADRLAGRRHEVTLMVPARHGWRSWWRNLRDETPTWIPGFRPTVRWIRGWDNARLPDGDALIATAWQTARTAAEAPDRCGRKLYFIQHYEGLYHGDPGRVDATYALPYDEFHENLPQERLAWLYSRCPIYLCPSWDEGLGMPPMEAMACGAALVTFDNGGCRDYAMDGETALVAPRRDVGALARALERMVGEPPLRERLARQGQAFVTSRFDWDRASARLEDIIREGS